MYFRPIERAANIRDVWSGSRFTADARLQAVMQRLSRGRRRITAGMVDTVERSLAARRVQPSLRAAVLAALPPLEVIQAQLLGLLMAPATQVVRLLNEPGSALARLVDAIGKKNGDAVPAAGSAAPTDATPTESAPTDAPPSDAAPGDATPSEA